MRLFSVVLAAVLSAAAALPVAAQNSAGYTVTDLGVIPGAGAASSSQPRAINDSGWVVGDMPQYRLSTAPYKGWVWIPSAPNSPIGSMRALEPLAGGTTSAAFDLNNQGLIVGVASTASGTNAAAFWQAPDFAPRDYNLLPRDPADPSLANWRLFQAYRVSDPLADTGETLVFGGGTYLGPSQAGFAYGVNYGVVWRVSSAGTIVGITRLVGSDVIGGDLNNRGQVTNDVDTALGWQAALWDSLHPSDGINAAGASLGDLGGNRSFGNGINDAGTVTGQSTTSQGYTRGFVWVPSVPNGDTGTLVALGALGGSHSYANGLNSQNQIVGRAYLKGNKTLHACLWQSGAITPADLNGLKTAGATNLELLEAYQINNSGAIIASYATTKGYRAVLLTPR